MADPVPPSSDPRRPPDPSREAREATYRIAEAALTAPDLDRLFAAVHGIVRGLTPADNFYIALHDRDRGTVSFPYWVDQMEATQPTRPFSRGLTEFVLRTGAPQLVDEVRLRALLAEGEVDAVGPEALAWLGVPLLDEDGPFGVLAVQSYEGGHPYGPAERELLTFVSGQVAMAIARRRAETAYRLTRAAIDHARDSVFGMEEDGRFIFVNQAACEGLGYTREELLTMRVLDVDPSLDEAAWRQVWQEGRRGQGHRIETLQRRKDGSIRPVEVSRSFFIFEGRQVLFANVRDISERQAAEAALRFSEEKFSKAFHSSPDAINITRIADGTYLDVSEGFTRLLGWTREESVGRSALAMGIWADPADRERMVDLLLRQHGEFTNFEAPFRGRDGQVIIGLMSGKRMEVEGEPCLLTFTRDITERKQAEAALRTTEQRLWTVMKNSQAVIFQLDPEGRFLLSEGLALERMGLRPGQVVGQSALELYRDNPAILDQMQRALQGHGSRELVRVGRMVFENSLTPVLDEQGRLESVIGIATDVTRQQEVQEALEAERGLFVGGPVMVIRWRSAPGWPVDYVSPNIRSILGLEAEELTSGRVAFDSLVHPEDLAWIHQDARERCATGALYYEQEYRLRTASGEYRWFHDFTSAALLSSGVPYYLGYMLDITERRQAEEALRQAQKLESLGVLAGGIAHDFNNLLTAVLGNLNLAQMTMAKGNPAEPYLENMERAILKAAELTKQMLAYSGRGHFVVQPQDLNQVVRELTHLLEVSISKKVALHFDLDPDLPPIEADAAQIQQVAMNLVTNASDAIGDREGRIRIRTGLERLEGDRLQTAALPGQDLQPGSYAVLEVEDTGCGMNREVLERIFDPFFTTKSTGRGLGLSALLGILRGHNAGLRITSEPGHGSTFQLYFPAASGRTPEPAETAPEAGARGMQGRVLVVDDEELILETTAITLTALGFEVETARDGAEALARVEAGPDRLDLVLMDLTMPRMDGREAFLAMRRLAPGLPVVLSSGYTEQDSLQAFNGEGPAAFLQKPYLIQDLRRVIQSVLGKA
ncbi:MAG TPA: PAS domain S-box protein [Holophagaceae bacterium]